MIFFKTIKKKAEEGSEEKEKTYPIMKMYFVFNVEQTSLPLIPIEPTNTDFEKYMRAKDIVENFTT